MFLKAKFKFIGQFENKERAFIAWEVAHAIFEPYQSHQRQMRSDEISNLIDLARKAAMHSMPAALDPEPEGGSTRPLAKCWVRFSIL